MKREPTFTFDGFENSLQLVKTLYSDIGETWTFIFQFVCRQAGYGDRTGQMLAQVLTPHKAVVTVAHGNIKSALMDEKWDMVTRQFIDC